MQVFVKTVTDNVIKHSPNAIIIVVSNPLDVMTYCAYLNAKLPSNKVFGMAGILDTARYKAFLATELNVSPKDIQAVLMGGHGGTMVPLPRYTTVGGIPVTELIAKDRLDAIIDRTKKGGGEIVNLLGTSAGHFREQQLLKWWKQLFATKESIPCLCLVKWRIWNERY